MFIIFRIDSPCLEIKGLRDLYSILVFQITRHMFRWKGCKTIIARALVIIMRSMFSLQPTALASVSIMIRYHKLRLSKYSTTIVWGHIIFIYYTVVYMSLTGKGTVVIILENWRKMLHLYIRKLKQNLLAA